MTDQIIDIKKADESFLDELPFVPESSNHFVVFCASDGVNGYELWISDGTEAGTNMIGDLNPSGDLCYQREEVCPSNKNNLAILQKL